MQTDAVLRKAGAGTGVLALAVAACTAGGEEIQPPPDDFYFPTGLAVSPDERALAVVSANSDLRYDTGTVIAADVAEIRDIVDAWEATGEVPAGRDCRRAGRPGPELVCEAREVIPEGASVRIGNFATDVDVQDLEGGGAEGGGARFFVAVRGDPSITWIDADTEEIALDCGGEGAHPACGEEHRAQRVHPDAAPEDDDIETLPAEPFGVFVDGENEYGVVTHLSGANVSLFSAPADGAPEVSDVMPRVFQAGGGGLRSAVGVAGRRPGSEDDAIYVTSRSEPRLQALHVVRAGGAPRLVEGGAFDLRRLSSPSDDGRGIAFGAGGDRAYVVNRSPATLQIIDTSDGGGGRPADEPIGSVGLCPEGSNVEAADAGRGERVYVTCFARGEVWVIDPASRAVEAVIRTGAGPSGLAIAEGEALLFAASVLDDSVTVVDLDGESETRNRAVLRLGTGEQRDTP